MLPERPDDRDWVMMEPSRERNDRVHLVRQWLFRARQLYGCERAYPTRTPVLTQGDVDAFLKRQS